MSTGRAGDVREYAGEVEEFGGDEGEVGDAVEQEGLGESGVVREASRRRAEQAEHEPDQRRPGQHDHERRHALHHVTRRHRVHPDHAQLLEHPVQHLLHACNHTTRRIHIEYLSIDSLLANLTPIHRSFPKSQSQDGGLPELLLT